MRASSHIPYKSYQYIVDETNNLTRQSRTRSNEHATRWSGELFC